MPKRASTRGSFIHVCRRSVSLGLMVMFAIEGREPCVTPEPGGRKLGVESETGPRWAGDLCDREATRKERNWPTDGI